ncbi:MAG: hypothetical protein EOM67_15365 [Spirochaetia bacterium]|nr:hypothetical protein [Spirochaetia bacterium]
MELRIKNFQSIKNQTVALKGFTVLEGKSDCGKSALRRALDSLLFNSWDNAYLRKDTRTCELSLSYDDVTITQLKGSENSYALEQNGKRRFFDKVGTETPDAIKDLGFSMFETSQEYYNVHITTQLEPLYMVTYTPTENTRILNSLFDIDVFGEATNMSVADMTSTGRTLKQKEAELDNISTKLFNARASAKSKEKDLKALERIYAELKMVTDALEVKEALTVDKKKLKRIDKRIEAVAYYLEYLQ